MLWFGEPWASGICYDDNNYLRWNDRVPVPVGEVCLWCAEQFWEEDSGVSMGIVATDEDGKPTPKHGYTHKECLIRSTVGSVDHLEGRCTCHGGGGVVLHPARTLRQEALATWHWLQEHGG
jgi:hypothetical protein